MTTSKQNEDIQMTTYTIIYDTYYGEAEYVGDEGQNYQSFIKAATIAGIEAGLIDKRGSVLDHDHEIIKG